MPPCVPVAPTALPCVPPSLQRPPQATWTGLEGAGQPVTVVAWDGLHRRALPELRVEVLRVTRPQAAGTARDARVSWFVWAGVDGAALPLAEVVGEYGLRFSQEHG
ncbi:MAG: hypothetical protein M3Z04_07480, partial [Chloroflexota bacterium]|nr:hypothetical protein [Chloroflexota bacterium]